MHSVAMMRAGVIHITDIEAVETAHVSTDSARGIGTHLACLDAPRSLSGRGEGTRPKARQIAGPVRGDSMGLCAGGTRRAGGKNGPED